MAFQSAHPILHQVEQVLNSTRPDNQSDLARDIILVALASVKMDCPALVYVATDCGLVRIDVIPQKSDRELVVAQSVLREASMKIYHEMNRRQAAKSPWQERSD